MAKHILTLLLTVVGLTISAQVPDSLNKKYTNAKHDTDKVAVLIEMAGAVYLSNPPEAIKYCNQAKEIAEKVNYKRGIANVLGWLGYLYEYEGKIDITMDYYQRSIPLLKELGDEEGLGGTYLNMAVVYADQGNIPKSLEYNQLALESSRKTGNKKSEAFVLNNMAGILREQGEPKKALEYMENALKIRQSVKDKDGIAESYNNLGYFYDNVSDNKQKALEYYLKSNEMYTTLNNKRGISYTLHNIASLYSRLGDTTRALENYYKSLQIKESVNLVDGMPPTLTSIATILIAKHNEAEAEKLLLRSFNIGKTANNTEAMSSAANALRKLYKKQRKFQQALEMFEIYKTMRDTIYNQSNRKETYRSQLKYDFDKKEFAANLTREKEKAEARQKQQKQQYIIWSVVGGLCIVAFFLFIIYNRLQLTRKQKLIIEQQKELVETQQKEIIDSINYARRIQYALLAGKTLLQNNLQQHFILFKPKNVVSGDFYWAVSVTDGFIFVLGDCTGHGVPGAFMSLLNISKLNQTINENKITAPDKVLNNVRKEIISSLNPDGSTIESKDGMDAVICKLDTNKMKLQYAAANNPLYIVRNKEIIVYNADKMPVGMGHDDTKLFTLHEIELQKNDMIYLSTDGYPDQFGGPKGKKFMYKKFQELLVSVSTLPVNEQYQAIEKALADWQGNLEQVDDISVIGIRI